jgi:prepilin-type N-terminal cleavage/methylation domain-containing protein
MEMGEKERGMTEKLGRRSKHRDRRGVATRHAGRQRGFTLVELLVVIAIIGGADRAALAGDPGRPRSSPPQPMPE